MIEVVEERGIKVENWERETDNCFAQYKSQYVVEDLFAVKEKDSPALKSVSFNYFESNEGKNLSDTIGSLFKHAVERQTALVTEALPNYSRLEIAKEIVRRGLAGMNIEPDGRCGSFAFFV